MDPSEMEENLFVAGEAKLHGGMSRKLSAIVCRLWEIFPVLEAARPRSKSGMQALCSLHVALDKAKNLLLHCSNCSKLYLAITGGSILLKFEKARCALKDGLKHLENIVPQTIERQVMEIVGELELTIFSLDQSEKQAGDDVIQLLQEKKISGNSNDNEELEIFHQAATSLGITSSRAALTERRALKKLVERARLEEDKRKESIVSYLLHLMRKYSKLFRNEVTDVTDSQGLAPCSPTVLSTFEDSYRSGVNALVFDRQLSKLSSFNSKPSNLRLAGSPTMPEELRCPISLQLMYDPVIISSGQTYERLCIEKWFNDGHHTCPKTQQQLPHLGLTPNYCVKDLIASWCEQNAIPIPESPPDSLDLNYWRLALSEGETMDSRSMGSVDSCKLKSVVVAPLEEASITEALEGNCIGTLPNSFCQGCEVDELEKYKNLLSTLYDGKCVRKLEKIVEHIGLLLKDDEEARTYMGANGFTEALVWFLRLAVEEREEKAQEVGAMALFNLAVNNDRNKGMMMSTGVVPLLEEMISDSAYESAIALFLNLSCLDDAKPVIGSSKAVPFLIELLRTDECKTQCRADALHTLYNLSAHAPNIPFLLSAGIVCCLQYLIYGPFGPAEGTWAEKSVDVFINLASNKSGKKEIISTPGLVGAIAAILDTSEPSEQEQAVSCLLILCNGNQECSHMVLQEGVIPVLVSLSVNGTQQGKEKAHKLLMLFREQRQRDISPLKQQPQHEQQYRRQSAGCNAGGDATSTETKPLCKSASKRMSRTLSAMWKSKHYSVTNARNNYQVAM